MPLPILFALTMFVSATLLFLVQPMIGKMVLPLLGGTPAVWNTCMVFYQALLLAGYYYSHKATSNLDTKRQTSLHGVVMLAALGVLALAAIASANHSPIPIVKSLSPQGDDYPFFGVIVLLMVAIGLPFFVVSTSAPLLQKWFAETGHPSSRDPYFLYAASNFGSLLALIAYPAVVEPNLRLIHQAWIWAIGYVILVVLVLWCAKEVRQAKLLAAARPSSPPPRGGAKPQAAAVAHDDPEPSPLRKLRWLALAFVPSSLMLGVTTFVTYDMMSVPLLWIIPLSLYLITFIIVFSKVPKELHVMMTMFMPVMVLLLAFLMTSHVPAKFGLQVLLHMATFFVVAMVCHGELARDRPSPKHLTGFYLIMSVGGMLGGLFNALIAPIVFTFTSEYPITLVAACFLLPPMFKDENAKPSQWAFFIDVVAPAAIFCLACVAQAHKDEIGGYIYENGRYALAAGAVFVLLALPAVALLARDLRSRVALAILLGVGLATYAIAGPPARYLLWNTVPPKLFVWLSELYRGSPSSAEWQRILVRLLTQIIPAGIYVWYWKRFGPKESFGRHLLIGPGVLTVCLGAMLFAAVPVADKLIGVMAIKENIQASTVVQILIYGVPAMVCYFFVERPVRFGAAVAALWLASFYTEYRKANNPDLHPRYRSINDRSFFGRLKIDRNSEWNQWIQIPIELFPDAVDDDKEQKHYTRREETGPGFVDTVFSLKATGEMVYTVRRAKNDKGEEKNYFYARREFIQLVHGTTIHGLQESNKLRSDIVKLMLPGVGTNWVGEAVVELGYGPDLRRTATYPGRDPLTYYHRDGPVGSMFTAWEGLNRQKQRTNTDVACIGLGTGSLASYGLPGQTMVFFEIDTHVRRLVEAPTFFTYIDAAKRQGVNLEFVMGDARVSLERQERKYGFMLIDAFSSDAIPAHLLTKEAVELYFSRLEDDGLLTVHVSNRYLRLEPVVERICRELKLEARVMHGTSDDKTGKYAATWIAIAKTREALGAIDEDTERWLQEERPGTDNRWMRVPGDDKVGLWTDDYSPIIPVLRGEWRFWSKDE